MFEESLMCDECNENFGESTKLPCGITICNYCKEDLVDSERQDNSLKCTICLGAHKYEEVFRRDLVEEFKENLNKIYMKKAELEGILLNGADTVKEHCFEMRFDVDLVTEKAIEEIQQHRDKILKEINEYEAKTVALIKIEEKTRSKFESSIKSLDDFTTECKSYLTESKIDEKEVAVRNGAALELIRKAGREKKKLNSLVFNKKMIWFTKNEKLGDMSNIGVVKYRYAECNNLKDLKKIDIQDFGRFEVQVYPQEDSTYLLLFIDNKYGLTQVVIDSEKKIISPSKTFIYGHSPISQFTKHKNNIFVYHHHPYGDYHCISKLNHDFSAAKTININYSTFLSANEVHVYAYCNKQLCIYNSELELLRQVGQSMNPEGCFYFPTGINQFESHKGMYYWLSFKNLQILREDNGKLVESVAVQAENFFIDSNDNVVLFNNATKELNFYTADGILVDQIPLDIYTTGLRVSMTKDGEPVLNSDTTLYA